MQDNGAKKGTARGATRTIAIFVFANLLLSAHAFSTPKIEKSGGTNFVLHPSSSFRLNAANEEIESKSISSPSRPLSRSSFLNKIQKASIASILTLQFYPPSSAHAKTQSSSGPSLTTTLAQLKEARQQLDAIPSLIKEEKWDSVRAILITPPLSDCWAKTAKPLLPSYAQALGSNPDRTVDDDAEFSALEFKEDALDHLRFLDMAVYNNVFNPIKTEGENGATKELIRSYYEDPLNEYNACVKAFDGLISLVKED